jgi:hypothetical protein
MLVAQKTFLICVLLVIAMDNVLSTDDVSPVGSKLLDAAGMGDKAAVSSLTIGSMMHKVIRGSRCYSHTCMPKPAIRAILRLIGIRWLIEKNDFAGGKASVRRC